MIEKCKNCEHASVGDRAASPCFFCRQAEVNTLTSENTKLNAKIAIMTKALEDIRKVECTHDEGVCGQIDVIDEIAEKALVAVSADSTGDAKIKAAEPKWEIHRAISEWFPNNDTNGPKYYTKAFTIEEGGFCGTVEGPNHDKVVSLVQAIVAIHNEGPEMLIERLVEMRCAMLTYKDERDIARNNLTDFLQKKNSESNEGGTK